MAVRLTKAAIPALWLIWGLSVVSFLVGIFMPIMSIRQLYLFEDQFSVLSALNVLAADGQLLLALVIAVFSLGIPLLKIGVFAKALVNFQQGRSVHSKVIEWIHRFGRWSMLDVFVFAVLIVSIKLSAFASVDLHLGLWAFSGALLLLLLLTSLVKRLDNS